MTLIVNTDFSG